MSRDRHIPCSKLALINSKLNPVCFGVSVFINKNRRKLQKRVCRSTVVETLGETPADNIDLGEAFVMVAGDDRDGDDEEDIEGDVTFCATELLDTKPWCAMRAPS